MKVEVAVKKILAGLPVKNQGALSNPKSLELYKNIPETQSEETEHQITNYEESGTSINRDSQDNQNMNINKYKISGT